MGISLSHNKYEEIKKIIVNLFSKYNVTCVPVNGFELATKMGVKIIPYSAIPLAKRYLLLKKANNGFCVEKSIGEWYIYYNDEMDYRRINNTIMHEIGHIVLDHSEDSELAEKRCVSLQNMHLYRLFWSINSNWMIRMLLQMYLR